MIAKDRLTELKERYLNYCDAERAILKSQSYSMEGVSLTRANLDTVQKMIAKLEAEILKTERVISGSTRSRIRVGVPVDSFHYSLRRVY